MSAIKSELLILKGAISEMPEADRAAIADCAEKIRAIVKASADAGGVALCLCAAEFAAEQEAR